MGGDVFAVVRARRPEDVPRPDDRIVDVAVLDMNHDWPNLGHDSIVGTVGRVTGMLQAVLAPAGMGVRIVSFPVRNTLMVPDPGSEQFRLVVGTGGPGHIDPNANDGTAEYAQGIKEDPTWEPRFHALMNRVRSDERFAMVAICHSFGLVCRWAGVARPTLRGPAKGGKSAGIKENLLTDDALAHPWFSRMARELPDGRHLKIADSRLFDLLPGEPPLPAGMMAIGFEANADGSRGDALTMLEVARDRVGLMPRVFAVNHHPEIFDLELQRELLAAKLERGEVTREWCDERRKTISELLTPVNAASLLVTARYTFIIPIAYHLYRLVRERRMALGQDPAVHEDQTLAPGFITERRRTPRGPEVEKYTLQ